MKTERTLTSWGILVIDGHGPYLAGTEPSGMMRTSTALLEFDEATMTAKTAAGRPYRLVGPEVRREAVNTLLSLWELPDGVRPRFLDLDEVVPTIERNGNRPQDLTPEQEADLRLQRLLITGRSIAKYVDWCERYQDVTLEDFAEVSDLSLEEWRSIVDGAPAGTITVERAEAALMLAANVFNGDAVLPRTRTWGKP